MLVLPGPSHLCVQAGSPVWAGFKHQGEPGKALKLVHHGLSTLGQSRVPQGPSSSSGVPGAASGQGLWPGKALSPQSELLSEAHQAVLIGVSSAELCLCFQHCLFISWLNGTCPVSVPQSSSDNGREENLLTHLVSKLQSLCGSQGFQGSWVDCRSLCESRGVN